jgi:hypothetical protein
MTSRNPIVQMFSLLSRAGANLWRRYVRVMGCCDGID